MQSSFLHFSIFKSSNFQISLLLFFLSFSGLAQAQPRCCWTPDSMPVTSTLRDSLNKRISRFEKEILAFEAQDDTLPYPQNPVLFTGSSTIRLWKNLGIDMSPLPVMNRGFGGATLMELSHYANRIVYKYNPRAIVIYCGENDMAVDYSRVEDVLSEFRALDSLRRVFLPKTKVFFVSIKPSPSRAFYSNKFNMANQLVQGYVKLYPEELYYIDITPCMYTSQGQLDESIFRKDRLHMNSTGYERWSKIIKPILSTELQIKVK